MRNKAIVLGVLITLLLIGIFGVTYSVFNYSTTESSQQLITGDIYLNFIEGSNIINLNNELPMTKREALNKNDHVFNFKVIGKNTSNKNVYYGISLFDGDTIDYLNRIGRQYVKVYLEEDGKVVINGENLNVFDDDYLYVSKVSANTMNEIERNYSLRVWIDNNIVVDDEYERDFTLSEWNQLYASYKIHVETANINVMDTFPSTITNVKNSISKVYFVNDTRENIDNEYNQAIIKADLTYDNQGNVKGYLQKDPIDTSKYILYVKSVGKTYLNTGRALFNTWKNVTSMDFTNANTVMVTNMSNMFTQNYALTNLNISNFNTSKVTNMGGMFMGCVSLVTLDLKNFNTSQVTTMSAMFSGWDDRVNRFSSMALTNINLTSFDTSKVTTMQDMFFYNNNLVEIDLSSFSLNSLTNISTLFQENSALEKVYVSDLWNVPNNLKNTSVFYGCSTNLKGQNGTTWSSNKVTALYARIDKSGESGYFTYKDAPEL